MKGSSKNNPMARVFSLRDFRLLFSGAAPSPTASGLGIGLALAIDALSFAVSAICLGLIRTGGLKTTAGATAVQEGAWTSILAGIQHLWNDEALRVMFLAHSACCFF